MSGVGSSGMESSSATSIARGRSRDACASPSELRKKTTCSYLLSRRFLLESNEAHVGVARRLGEMAQRRLVDRAPVRFKHLQHSVANTERQHHTPHPRRTRH